MLGVTDDELPEGRKLPQFVAGFIASCTAFLIGTILAWSSPVSPKLSVPNEYNFVATEFEISWLGSSMTLGAAATCFPAGFLMNIIGRKGTLIAGIIPAIIGWSMILSAQNILTMIFGRVFLGMCLGTYVIVGSVYIGEISEKHVRGTIGSFIQVNITLGILFVFSVYMLSVFWISFICLMFSIVIGLSFLLIPETPTYLIAKQQDGRALRALRWLRGSKYDVVRELEILQTEEKGKLLMNKDNSLGKSLKRRENLRALAIVIGLAVFQQGCGVNIITFYLTDIFSSANSQLYPEIQSIIVGFIQVVMAFVVIPILDKLGRRIMLISSGITMSICMFLLGFYFFAKDRNFEFASQLGWLPVTALGVFIIGYAIGVGSVTFLIYGEICSPEIKGFALGCALTLSYLTSFITTKFFIDLVNWLTMGPTFWVYCGTNIIGTLFVFLMLPETMGKSLSEIQQMLREKF